MTGLSNNKEFLRMSIFFLWLINISGFFGMLSDQNEFFLSTTPYVLSLTLLLLILNHNLSSKKSKIGLMLIFLFGLNLERSTPAIEPFPKTIVLFFLSIFYPL